MPTPRRRLESAGKNDNMLVYHPEDDYYSGAQTRLPTVNVEGKRRYPYKKSPYWVSAKNKQLNLSDISKAYTAATVGLLPNPVSAIKNVSKGKLLDALSDLWLYNSDKSDNPNINYGVVGFNAPEGGLFNKITKANAATKTAQEWDDAYNAAINSGNMKEAKRLRGLHFEIKAGNYISENGRPKTLYRGDRKSYNSLKARNEDYGYWTTTDENYALNFTKNVTAKENHGYIDRYYHQGDKYKIRKLYAKSDKPVEYNKFDLDNYIVKSIREDVKPLKAYKDKFGDLRDNISKQYDLEYEKNKYLRTIGTDNVEYLYLSKSEKLALQNKYPKLRELEDEIAYYKKIVEAYPGDRRSVKDFIDSDVIYGHDVRISDYGWDNSTGIEYSFNSPSQLKLKDVITYDDKGKPIPLSKRDNFKINDIRYGLLPLIVAGTAAKLLNGKRNNYSYGGSIHISPSKRGTFTSAATKHNMSVQEFANKVLRNKSNYSPAMVKKANFARNASKWNN